MKRKASEIAKEIIDRLYLNENYFDDDFYVDLFTTMIIYVSEYLYNNSGAEYLSPDIICKEIIRKVNEKFQI